MTSVDITINQFDQTSEFLDSIDAAYRPYTMLRLYIISIAPFEFNVRSFGLDCCSSILYIDCFQITLY